MTQPLTPEPTDLEVVVFGDHYFAPNAYLNLEYKIRTAMEFFVETFGVGWWVQPPITEVIDGYLIHHGIYRPPRGSGDTSKPA